MLYLILKINIIKVNNYITIIDEIVNKIRFLKFREDLKD